MVYNWKCSHCPEITEVHRSLADIDVPPYDCVSCGSCDFSHRVIVSTPGVKQFILVEGGCRGWQFELYHRNGPIQ
jgi:hypothetical protein